MNKLPEIRRFQSEAQEAQWWFDHREETSSWMEKTAGERGATNLSEVLQRRRQAGPTPTVSIRIDPGDLSRAKILAGRRGLRYQTYLKMLLHEAIDREDRPQAG
jgi:hypothetical protein